jgi:hypothetical protein
MCVCAVRTLLETSAHYTAREADQGKGETFYRLWQGCPNNEHHIATTPWIFNLTVHIWARKWARAPNRSGPRKLEFGHAIGPELGQVRRRFVIDIIWKWLTMLVARAELLYRERACVSMCLPTHGARLAGRHQAGRHRESERRRAQGERGKGDLGARREPTFHCDGPLLY